MASTFRFDDKLSNTVADLKAKHNLTSEGEVVRRAIALLRATDKYQLVGDDGILHVKDVNNGEHQIRLYKQQTQ